MILSVSMVSDFTSEPVSEAEAGAIPVCRATAVLVVDLLWAGSMAASLLAGSMAALLLAGEEILGTKMDMWGRDIGKEELMRKISDEESQQTWEGIKRLIKIWEVNAEQGEVTGVQVQDGE